MAFRPHRRNQRPFLTDAIVGWVAILGISVGSVSAQQVRGERLEPALGWLGGEGPRPVAASVAGCDAGELKHGPLAKIGRELATLLCRPHGQRSSRLARLIDDPGGRLVVIDTVAAGSISQLASDLERLGGRQVSVYGPVASALFPVARLDALAALPTLGQARPFAAATRTGTVTGQHVAALDIAGLVTSGFDGGGVTLGVLSDSYDCLGGAAGDVASDDLPAGVVVLEEEIGCGAGADEGRAMMQLVHDLVPGAAQAFHSAFNGVADFAGGIQDLANIGATVIVDDIFYLNEPMFQDGVITQAVDNVSVGEVAYFSSAGNQADQSWESAFDNSGTVGRFGGRLHDFDPGSGVDTRQTLTLAGPDVTLLVFNWDQPYASATGLGGSATDVDVHLYFGGVYLFSAAGGNIGGDPIEIMGINNTGGPATVEIEIEYFDGPGGPAAPIPTFLKYLWFNTTTVDEYASPSGTAFGHANAAGAIAVGAANYWRTPAFGQDPALLASYSSHGGVAIYYDLADNRIGPLDRGKPEIVAADGANTTFFGVDIADPGDGSDLDAFPNFFGTSAAAPIAATVAVMMQQSRPGITRDEIESCITRTGADMGAAGFDFATGNGFIQPEAALACAAGDWGDLPDGPYQTLEASGAARHVLDGVTWLGSQVDRDDDGQPDTAASGDDGDGTDDEDGVLFLDPLVAGRPARIEVTASTAGFLNAWIDFDSSLGFDPGEQVRLDVPLATGSSTFEVAVPASAAGVMYSRFRFTADDPAGALGSTGSWPNGEVEDYALAALGDRAWNDDGSGGGVVGDGVQNGSEPGFANVVVALLDSSGNAITDALGSSVTVLTDAAGGYQLSGLAPGAYRLEFQLPAGASGFSPPDVGDDTLDSDVDPATGRTLATAVSAGSIDTTVDAGVRAPTVALISHVAAHRDRHGVVVEWRTAAETGTLAFEVYRTLASGRRRLVNEHPLPALLSAPQGGVYRLRDRSADDLSGPLEYWFAEIEANGSSHLYGPYRVTPQESAAEFVDDFEAVPAQRVATRRRELPPPAASVARGGQRADDSAVPGSFVAKLAVRNSGVTVVTSDALAELLGRPESEVAAAIAAGRAELTLNGEPVAWHPLELPTPAVLFLAEPRASLYSRDTVYRLELGKRGPLMTIGDGAGALPRDEPWFEATIHYEEDLLPAIAATEQAEIDFWQWQYLLAGDPELERRQFELAVPDARGDGNARLTVHLTGGNRGPVLDEHLARISVNGIEVGSVRWDDKERPVADFIFDASLLTPQTTVEIVAELAATADFSLYFVDGFDLRYRRHALAINDQLELVADASGVVTVGGFSAPDLIAIDATAPAAPVLLRRITVDNSTTEDSGPYRATVAAPAGARVVISRLSAASPPAALTQDRASNLRSAVGAEYLVVAPESLLEPARRLANYRQADGLTTMVIDLADVHDEFAHSQPTPWALREMLRHAVASWEIAPRYLLLAGAGTFDPRDLLGHGDNLLTPLLAGTPQGLAAADNLLADLEGDDGLPELAIGRLPVLTAAEFEDYVRKLQAFEAAGGSWRQRLLLVADDADAGGDFARDSEVAAAAMPGIFDRRRIYLGVEDPQIVRQALLDGWRQGALMVHYAGHGGVDRLAAEGLLLGDDATELGNGWRLPVLTAMTCVVGRFEVPGFDGLGERLVLAPEGGAVAVWAPTGLSQAGAARELAVAFYRQLPAGGETVRLGDAVRAALAAAGPQAPGQLTTFTLLGDPALHLGLAP